MLKIVRQRALSSGLNKYSSNHVVRRYNTMPALTSFHYHPIGTQYFSTTAEVLPKKSKRQPKKKKPTSITTTRRRSTQTLQRELESALEKGGERVLRVRNLDQEIPVYSERLLNALKTLPSLTASGIKLLTRSIYIAFTEPQQALKWVQSLKEKAQTEIKHYWLGTKLLYADVSTSTRIIRRVLSGNSLTRRERKQLQRTVTDLVRLVPFSFFIIIPFMELLLPVALKLFPNMLPSTYQDSYQKEENMKKQLQLRLSLAEFLQNTVKDIVQTTRDSEKASEETQATVEEVLDFIDRAQSGETLSSEEILKFASLFNDELMLDNISRPQLVGMCRFMALQPYGNDNFLRFQLRNKIRQLKKDDQDIIWEGLDTLTKEELQTACLDRGMRSTGLTKAGYTRQMKQWLDLSINKNVPASLLIMSRALNITASERPEVALAASMSSMDEEVVTEVALEAAVSEETTDMKALKLESIRYQNELIADEEKDREENKKKAEDATDADPDLELFSDRESAMQIDDKEHFAKEANMIDPASPMETMFSKPVRELSLDEVSALESFVFQSSVEKERKALRNIKRLKSEMDVQGLLAAGRIGNQITESKSASRMMKKIDSMILNLENELEEVDRTIGDRLNFLDKDGDGILSAEELQAAVKNILRSNYSEEDAVQAVSQLDSNRDGKISVAELVQWIEKRTNLLELTGRSTKDHGEIKK